VPAFVNDTVSVTAPLILFATKDPWTEAPLFAPEPPMNVACVVPFVKPILAKAAFISVTCEFVNAAVDDKLY